ncbi:MAG: LEA type 2 family protein [Myxococcales bacterium]|nr:LEA type 2 family protein [Myxococcales bacterium]MDP3502554.1 LEA type 2 family protein [Myxococcales bacterium]
MTIRALFAAALLCLAGCKSAPETKADVKEAELPRQDMQVATQSLTDVTVKLSGEILAGDEALTITGADVEFVVDGNVLSTKPETLNLSIAAGQTAPFGFEETFTYVKDGEDLKAMDARGGSILIALRGNLKGTVQREVVGADGKPSMQAVAVELPFARSREVRTPRLPHLKMGEFEAGRFSDSEVQAVFHLLVVNTNNFPVTLSSITYEVSLAGKKVAEGTHGVGLKTAIASTDVFDVSAVMNEESHGKDVKKLIKGLVVPYEVKAELKTPLYSEPLSAKGDIKLTVSKDK